MGANNTVSLISPSIKSFIERRQQALDGPDGEFSMANNRKFCFHQEANRHSAQLELLGIDVRTKQGKRVYNSELRRTHKLLNEAYVWGSSKYPSNLSLEFIAELAQKIEPDYNFGSTRSVDVRVSGALWSPPGFMSVVPQLKEVCFLGRYLDKLDLAFYMHYQITRIHPFEDGNGRTARLVQNLTLCTNHFLPPILGLDKRKEYLQLLSDADTEYRNLSSSGDLILDGNRNILSEYQSGNLPRLKPEYLEHLSHEILRKTSGPKQTALYDFLALMVKESFDRVIGKGVISHRTAR